MNTSSSDIPADVLQAFQRTASRVGSKLSAEVLANSAKVHLGEDAYSADVLEAHARAFIESQRTASDPPPLRTDTTVADMLADAGKSPPEAHHGKPRHAPTATEPGQDRDHKPEQAAKYSEAGESEEESAPFPTSSLPPAARDMAQAVATAKGIPEAMAGAVALGILSAALGAGLRIRTHCGDTGGNLYILIGTATGNGKDQVLEPLSKPLRDCEGELVAKFHQEIAPKLKANKSSLEAKRKKFTGSSEESRQEDLASINRDLEAVERDLERVPGFILNDTTGEALAFAMKGQPGNAVASITSEGRRTFSLLAGHYTNGDGDEAFYCASYSGSPWTVSRITRESFTLPTPTLALTWLLQPDALHEALARPELIESGFLPRCLMFDSLAEPQPIPSGGFPKIPEPVTGAWDGLIASLVEEYRQVGDDPRTVDMGRDPLALLIEEENRNRTGRRSDGELSDVAGFAARWTENTYRVALLLHAAEHGSNAHAHPVTLATAEAARAIVQWFSERQLAMIEPVRTRKKHEADERLLGILSDKDGEVSTYKLRNNHGFGKSFLDGFIERHPEFEITIKKPPGRGRPSEVLRKKP